MSVVVEDGLIEGSCLVSSGVVVFERVPGLQNCFPSVPISGMSA